MTEKLKLNDLIQPEFRTSEAASKKNDELSVKLGTHRYGPARLALALSLADNRPIKTAMLDNKGKAIRGRALFGEGDDMAAWVALITQQAGRELDKQEFTTAVAVHWERGINMLSQMWKGAEGDFDRFIAALSEKGGLSFGGKEPQSTASRVAQESPPLPGAVDLHIGEYISGDKKSKSAQWRINASGYPPHIAVMGASGGGKTHLALEFAKAICEQSKCPIFIFDMKGDIAEDKDLCKKIGAGGTDIIKCPGTSVPLDILYVADRNDNTMVQNTATRFCDSLACVIRGASGAVQMDRLRQVTANIITQQSCVSILDLRNALIERYEEDGANRDSVIAALNRIHDFNLFVPTYTPADFFSKSWIFVMNQAAPEIQRFAALMILEALNRYFSSLPNAESDSEGNRQITALLMIDEAHKILGFKHPALSDILRLSRSKGGVAILISQSPNDYMNEDVNFLENIGLTITYQTNATSASLMKVFPEQISVSLLSKGVCYARLSGQGISAQKIKVWE